MTTYDEEYEKYNIIKNNYDCDVIINNEVPYTLYKADDIGKILGFGNIRTSLMTFDDNEKIKIKKKTSGGIQNVTYITYNGLIKLLLKSRKPESIVFCNLINLDKKTKYYVSIETDIVQCILKTFDGNIMKTQYKVDDYYIDLYFPEYLLAIECDELHHKSNKINDSLRNTYITCKIGCRFIRFNPFDKTFNLFELLNNIYIHLNIYRKNILNNL